MRKKKGYTNKLNIYLIKKEYTDFGKIIKEGLNSLQVQGVGTIYYGESSFYKPSWLNRFFGGRLEEIADVIFNASSKAILIIAVDVGEEGNRIFAIPFGFGWTLLNPGVYEERFGLKVTLNTVDHDRLRAIKKVDLYGIPKNTTEQLIKEGVTADFGINIEQDLVTQVAGISKIPGFGKRVEGKDALSLSVKVDHTNIKKFLKDCYEKYCSDDYKERFGWIDHISDIKDPVLKELLNSTLVTNIRENNIENIWMAVPEVVDWYRLDHFSFERDMNKEFDDIDLNNFLECLSDEEKAALDLGVLNSKVYYIGAENGEILHVWKVFNCLYCEITDDDRNKTYLLNNGNWYEIENDFASEVNEGYRTFRDTAPSIGLPTARTDNEDQYIKYVSENSEGFHIMHKVHIINRKRYNDVEFCDLMTQDKTLIHIKKYGTSRVICYLFQQGLISAELLLSEPDFRQRVSEKLTDGFRYVEAEKKPEPTDYTIVFAIISSKPGDLDIPFFSKVALRTVRRRLSLLGFELALQKIPVAGN